MSRLLITQYHAEVEKIIRYGGSRKETSIRNAFERLLNEYCKPRSYLLIPELEFKTKFNTTVFPDGTVKDAIRLEHGWWESKDQYDHLDEEIEKKLELGYPDENILFEDSQTAVLIQHSREQLRVSMRDSEALDGLISTFVDYERPEVRDFRSAIAKFKEDIPHIIEALRQIITQQEASNTTFRERRNSFLEVCRQSINPEIEIFDIHEMLIQHILTEDIFTNIFHESQFHRENNIGREISEIVNTFFTGATRRNTLKSIEHYYAVIRRKSENIANHHEKQKFLKAVYENFYKAYNPKAADRLGIVYTPNEIVRFMIESADYLVHKHFGKLLSDPGVEILDPCTGTGTYVTELIEYLPADKLEHKYKHEIHCNEVAILPYYIANLNIEFTYQQKMGKYEEFQNICLVDTLDHCGFAGKQLDLFAMSVQNTARIKEQNSRTISVIIGNPPYNANQENENDDNQNRKYPEVDKRIKETYIKYSRAKKTKRYDMYSRFYRWATDRLGDNGILAFITNSNFIDSDEADGFRKVVAQEFSDIYIIDLGGNVRANPKLSGTKNNVFGIQAGVAISFMIKKPSQGSPCRIYYSRRPEFQTADEKNKFLAITKFEQISFNPIQPDQENNWLNLGDSNFSDLVPLANEETKKAKIENEECALFKIFSIGISTNRDEWVVDPSPKNLQDKIRFFSDLFNQEKKETDDNNYDNRIKWSRNLKRDYSRGLKEEFDPQRIVKFQYRPFTPQYLYNSDIFVDEHGAILQFFPGASDERENLAICLTIHKQVPFVVQSSGYLFDAGIGSRGSHGVALYRYDENGNRLDNITDWGLTQFQTHYKSPRPADTPLDKGGRGDQISKLDIFHYTYAVLHHPAYRSKYELNLKREFPRLPFYPNFHQWVNWGKALMNLHLNYETIEPYGLTRRELKSKATPKPKLKADKIKGIIILDENTQLIGVPAIAWEYKLGNRSALEWILDQYKEKTPRDPTIGEKFNTYKFADYKEQVIDLLQRVCTLSVKTMEIIQQMPDTVEHQG
ncbi:type ISP restriction/modification enzyme [Limnoraphis robusta]|uniref:site-specific DNA-methyltransferase (adenine-specific) n=1 Tax=Limnoraphis robusta CS-951 TaxID=1637645 RepID=A0A0F5YME2_9CYAN|nr:type ISP restriction/modification enzyme [Limnoraphis robusta]KKD39832.1 DNA methyltransferase [Limnoraphis robusta CS-951]